MAELHPRPFIPFMLAAAGIGTFSLMDVAMKDLALSLGTYNAVMWRNCLGALFMGLLFIGTRQEWPPAHILKIHLWRGMVASVMSISFFWSPKRASSRWSTAVSLPTTLLPPTPIWPAAITWAR